MKTSSLTTLALLAAATLALQAEAPRFGVQGLVNIPLNELKTHVDSKPGAGIGVHGTFDLGDGHMLRPRLDYSVFPEATFASLKRNASNLSLGGDYLYFLVGKPEGLYLTAGLSAIRWSLEDKNVPGVGTIKHNATKLGVAAGVGYQWNATLGTEARLVHSTLGSDFSADMIQGCVTFRF